ncbi:MAG: DedA family protein [Alistipes sp.]|nr:DedA family protein [Rikenellaceae bacterium]MBQ4126435.1 DedA family protein [Alistipes sp.]
MNNTMEAITQFFIDWGYIGLFISAFVAGSILPFSSEVVLTVLVQMGADPTLSLIAASLGNTAGGLVCYGLGYLGNMEWIERWLKIDKQKMDKVSGFVKRYGAVMGLFGVLPWVGEVIIVLLGLMRSNVYITTLTMFIGKFIRYLLIILALQGVNSLF